jgi:hypothetical protein
MASLGAGSGPAYGNQQAELRLTAFSPLEILHLSGRDLRGSPLVERREALATLAGTSGESCRTNCASCGSTEWYPGCPPELNERRWNQRLSARADALDCDR